MRCSWVSCAEPRYVVFTDRLLAEMTPEEVEAVFGHEVGHVKHHHMLYYLGFIAVSFLTVMEVWEILGKELLGAWNGAHLATVFNWENHRDLAQFPGPRARKSVHFHCLRLPLRRCERQADVFGCRAVSCGLPHCLDHDPQAAYAPNGSGLCPTGIRIFMAALEKVAYLNGISRDRPGWIQSWIHSTIARRVEFLQSLIRDPALEPRFQRGVRLLKWALFLGLIGLLLLLGQNSGWASLPTLF